MTSQSPQHHRAPTILTVPGFNNSGPAHWQTLWEQSRSDTRRAELGMWATPHRNVWVTKLDQAIRNAHGPVILAAHSLGAIAVAWWAALAGQPQGYPVAGALLVAPADVDNSASPSDLSGFAPTPDAPLPFPSILVASTDDPWITIDRARSLAVAWGSHFVDAGPQGHLNAVSGLGHWDEGQALLDRLIGAASDEQGRPRAPWVARSLLATSTAHLFSTQLWADKA